MSRIPQYLADIEDLLAETELCLDYDALNVTMLRFSSIRHLIREICREIEPHPASEATLTCNGVSIMSGTPIFVRDDNKAGVVLALSLVDSVGVPTTVTTVPSWSLDNSAPVHMAVAADGMSATFNFAALGTANLTVVATNADGTSATATAVLQATSSDAVTATLSVVTPAPASAPAPAAAPVPAPTPAPAAAA